MPKLKFYDLKKKKSFVTDKFKIITVKTKAGLRYQAVTTAPSGIESRVFIKKEFAMKFK